jgi:hypothetical protein
LTISQSRVVSALTLGLGYWIIGANMPPSQEFYSAPEAAANAYIKWGRSYRKRKGVFVCEATIWGGEKILMHADPEYSRKGMGAIRIPVILEPAEVQALSLVERKLYEANRALFGDKPTRQQYLAMGFDTDINGIVGEFLCSTSGGRGFYLSFYRQTPSGDNEFRERHNDHNPQETALSVDGLVTVFKNNFGFIKVSPVKIS